MRKAIITALVLGLLAGSLVAPAEAKKKKKKKPVTVQVDQRYFLRRDDCASGADNTRLSTEDGEDVACSWDDAGAPWELYNETGLIDATELFPAENGVPFTLDASKPITGEFTLYHDPLCGGGACLPAGLTVGQATFTVKVIAMIAGEDKEIGVHEDTFTTTPGATHASMMEIPIDPALAGAVVEGFRIETFHGGQALGPGGIEYEDPAAFVLVPTLVTQ